MYSCFVRNINIKHKAHVILSYIIKVAFLSEAFNYVIYIRYTCITARVVWFIAGVILVSKIDVCEICEIVSGLSSGLDNYRGFNVETILYVPFETLTITCQDSPIYSRNLFT